MVHHKSPLAIIFTSGFLFATHIALSAYINSSFLTEGCECGISQETVGLLYTFASIITLVGFTFLPNIILRIGSRKMVLILLTIILIMLAGLATLEKGWLIASFFVLYVSLFQLVFYVIDVMIEHFANIHAMGKTRGTYLSIKNLGWVFAPLIAGLLISGTDSFRIIYGIGFVLVTITLLLLGAQLHPYRNPALRTFNVAGIRKRFLASRNIRNIIIAGFILQFFYAWMIIYMPIYLHQHMGLPWNEIGRVFTVMLAIFPLLQYPLGKLADKRHREKEMLIVGFIIMSFTTLFIAFVDTSLWWIWALILLGTRVGASSVEVLGESYFFKQIRKSDIQAISLYRDTQPLAYIAAPALASLLLSTHLVDIGSLFLVLGAITFSGIFFMFQIKNAH
jgi:MFS family permease